MEGDPPPEEATLFPTTVGEKLRGSRESQGIDIADVAARTRIPKRHLEAIERSNYGSLPSITYALGFAKAYARALGVDEVAIGRELRQELDRNYERVAPAPAFQMNDPTRTPSRGLMWVGILVAVLVLAGAGIWYATNLVRGSAPPPETLEIAEETPTPTPTLAPAQGGQVSLVALDTVWLRVTDAAGKVLYAQEMKVGDRFDVPPDADHPKVETAGPEKIQVVVNGSNVPTLGPAGRQVEVDVSAEALLGRGATPTPGPAAAAQPSRPARARPTPQPTQAPAPAPLDTVIPAPASPTP